MVSVPLSGLTSVNFTPSIFSSINAFSFRPLIGVNFCKLGEEDCRELRENTRFRPLIGVNFCKLEYVLVILISKKYGFRPLIGVNFCKREHKAGVVGAVIGFPSPYRG